MVSGVSSWVTIYNLRAFASSFYKGKGEEFPAQAAARHSVHTVGAQLILAGTLEL